jgi:hypothetical protein
MAQEEKYGTRDRTYSAWHRRLSTQRFIGIEKAQTLAMIDLDASLYVEYDDETREPLALIETARDVGQEYKVAVVTKRLAMRTQPVVPAYTLLYKLAEYPNPADKRWPDICAFRFKRLWPEPETAWKTVTPAQWAEQLVQLREWCAKKVDQQINIRRDRGYEDGVASDPWNELDDYDQGSRR